MSGKFKLPGFEAEIPDSIDGGVKNVLEPVTKGVGGTLGHLWSLSLGGWIGFLNDRTQLKYKFALEQYAQRLKETIQDIPARNKIEPNVQVAMSALTESLYCVESEELQELFAQLIAATMNSEKAEYVHPIFTSIVRQFSSEDATNFKMFMEYHRRPMWRIHRLDNSGVSREYLLIDNCQLTIDQQSKSAFKLKHLGVLNIYELTAIFVEEGKRFDDAYNLGTNSRLREYIFGQMATTKLVQDSDNHFDTISSIDQIAAFTGDTFTDRGVAELTDIGADLANCLKSS